MKKTLCKRKLVMAIGSVLCGLNVSLNVMAADKKATANTDGTTTLEEVTVSSSTNKKASKQDPQSYATESSSTGTKTDTPIMQTPVSIQVVPRAVMDDQKATRVTDVVENVSGVRSQPSLGTGTGFIIRGFRSGKVYRNGLVSNGGNEGFPSEFDTANLQSVEILKGPAAVLFGRIEPGGLVNLTTRKPQATPYYSLEQRFGSYDFYRTEWDATGGITHDNSLMYRFSGAYQTNYSFRDFNSSDRYLISPTVTWKISDATDFTVNVEGLNQDFRADYGIPAVGNRPANIPVSRSFNDPNTPLSNLHKVQVGTELNHHFNKDWAVHSRFLTTIAHTDTTFVNPTNAFDPAQALSSNGILHRNIFSQSDDINTYTTNLDLTGKFDIGFSKHETLIGIDYLHSKTNYSTWGNWQTPNTALDINIYNPAPTSYGINPLLFQTARATPSRTTNHSVFIDEWIVVYFQDHITLWDKVHILGGGRYDWARTGRGRGTDFSSATAAFVPRKDEGFSPRVGILYQPWSWLSVYGNWTTSFNANNGLTATGQTIKPQIGEQFEAGIKTSLFDDRLITSLAFYHLTKQNVMTTVAPQVQRPVGRQRSQGIELDMTGYITDGLSFIGNYAFTDARITKDNDGFQGNRMNNVPEHSGSAWLKYDLKGYKALDGLSFGLGGVAAGKREGNNDNTFQLPGYVRMDAFAAYRWNIKKTKVTAQFNIRNLLNKTYYESTDPDANVAPALGIYPGAPLTAMGSIRIEY
jgi:iron complex outermembrane receptor protein